MAGSFKPLIVSKAELATCRSRAAFFRASADEVSAKGWDWIAETFRRRADEYQGRADDLSALAALRTIQFLAGLGLLALVCLPLLGV